MEEELTNKLIVALICLMLKYAAVAWSLRNKNYRNMTEKIIEKMQCWFQAGQI